MVPCRVLRLWADDGLRLPGTLGMSSFGRIDSYAEMAGSGGIHVRKPRERAISTCGGFALTRKRGGVGRANPEETLGRAEHLRQILGGGLWKQVGDALSHAKTEADVLSAFTQVPEWQARRFTIGTMPGLVLATLQDRDFPKARSEAQIRFLADSLAACGDVSPRRSRQICLAERRKRGADPERYYAEYNETRSITGKANIGWPSTDPSGTKRG